MKEQAISPALEAALRDIQRRKVEIARLTADIARRTSDIDIIHKDQARVRENMSVLKRTSEERQLLQRYVKQLDDQETRMRVIEDDVRRLSEELTKAKASLSQALESLVIA